MKQLKTLMVLILAMLVTSSAFATATKPVASPFPGDEPEDGIIETAKGGDEVQSGGTDLFLDGGTRLVNLQNNDGGWDWPLDNGNPATGSALNTIGPIAMGLAPGLSLYRRCFDATRITECRRIAVD